MNGGLQSLDKLQFFSHPAITLSPLEDPLPNPLITHIFSQTYILKASLNYSQYVLAGRKLRVHSYLVCTSAFLLAKE